MQAHDPYWQSDLSLGEGVCYRNEQRPLRMRMHIGTEPYYGRQEIVPISQIEGERTCVHAVPYIILPQIRLPFGLSRKLSWSFKLGLGGMLIRWVSKAEWEGINWWELGNCHAWYYPQDRLLMLWDCSLYDGKAPRTDHTLSAIWNWFEQFLLKRFPTTERIVTPSWESSYETEDWQAFLTQQGYHRFNDQAFVKEVAPHALADYHPARESYLTRGD
jgi:hypothetical protein